MENSPSFSLNKTDIAKILKGLSLAMAGAAIVYLLSILDVLQLGPADMIWAGLASTLLNFLLKLIQSKQ